MTTKRWVISGSSALLVVLIIAIVCLVHGCGSDKPVATTATTVAIVPDQTVTLQKQNAALQAQNANLQKQIAEALTAAKQATEAANRASTMAKPQVVQTPAPQANQAVQQVLSHVSDSADMSLQMRTGRPAVFHELEQAALRQQERQNHLRGEVTPSAMPHSSRFELEQAKENEARLKDLVKTLRHGIMDAGSAKALRQNCLREGSASMDIMGVWRSDIRRFDEEISELGDQLTQAAQELQAATTAVARLSRATY